MSEPKQVIVIRRDLKMRRGKEIAQGSHASMMWLREWALRMHNGEDTPDNMPAEQREWLEGSYAKICVCANSEEELLDLQMKALNAGLVACHVIDQGRTEFDGFPTMTALAIGPDYPEKIDPITGHLKLY